jgi:glycosyltransferase involved in cell wall biosynthesis
MERLIEDMDQALLARNALTIVRMHLGRGLAEPQRTTREVGRGKLVQVAMPCTSGLESTYAEETIRGVDGRMLLRKVLNHPFLWSLAVRSWVQRRQLAPRPGEMIGAGEAFARLTQEFPFDLCVMHFFGSADADEVIRAARSLRLPVALSNHFANDRFLHLAIRQHVVSAAGVGGMNGLQVPAYLRGSFQNLADGIDLDFFHPRHARPPGAAIRLPVLFLPARILRSKGHLDVLRCARRLHDQQLPVEVVFAGRADSGPFMTELQNELQRLRLVESVRFLGLQSPEVLRDWYHASADTVFPTYHHEGLGRITIESQAMGTPAVAYATGGVAEGIKDGATGFLVPTGGITALTDRVAQLVRNPQLRLKMGRAARTHVEEIYGLSSFAQRHEAFYLSCLSDHPKFGRS